MKKMISFVLLCTAVAGAACSNDIQVGPPAKRYAVGDLYPNPTTPAGVVFKVEPTDETHGMIVSLDQVAGLTWAAAQSWRSAHALPSGMEWRIPSKDDLQYLFCAYAGVSPVAWSGGQAPFSPDPVAAAGFRDAVSASGAEFTDDYYWSSSEDGEGDVWVVGFTSGLTGLLFKTSPDCVTRCVASF